MSTIESEIDMALELMYITNNVEIAAIAEDSGVDRIWIDLERIGKQERQPGDTVKSNHTIEDIKRIKQQLIKSKVMVRVNPINESSGEEIDQVIKNGADIIMLPYYKTIDEVKCFLNYVDGRARTNLLLETKEADACLDETLELKGIDEIHIGLNDLHLSYGRKFMFELVADGTVERICHKIMSANLSYGFGGIARLGAGLLPADYLIPEHYRLGSTRVILARSFCNGAVFEQNKQDFEKQFKDGVRDIRRYEDSLKQKPPSFFIENQIKIKECIDKIIG